MRLRATGSCGVASQQIVSRVEDEGQSSQREGSVRLRAKRLFQWNTSGAYNEGTWVTYFLLCDKEINKAVDSLCKGEGAQTAALLLPSSTGYELRRELMYSRASKYMHFHILICKN